MRRYWSATSGRRVIGRRTASFVRIRSGYRWRETGFERGSSLTIPMARS